MLQPTACWQMLPTLAPKVTSTQVRCKAQASPIVQDDTQVGGLMDTVKALQFHVRELHHENQDVRYTMVGRSEPAYAAIASELEGLAAEIASELDSIRARRPGCSTEGSLISPVSQLESTCRSVAVQCEEAIPAVTSFSDVAARVEVGLTVTDVDAVRRSSAAPAADVAGVHHRCGTSSEDIGELRSSGSAGNMRSLRSRVRKDIKLCTMFGALLQELQGRDTEQLYEKDWVDDLMLLGEDVGNAKREILEQSPVMATRFALEELWASAHGRDMEGLYDTDWVGNFPPMQLSQKGRSAWMRLCNKVPRAALKAEPIDKVGRHHLADSIGQLPATTAGDKEAATLPEPRAANSAAAVLEASLTGNGSIVLEAFDEAILTSGGCCGAAPATFAQESEDDAPPIFHNGTQKQELLQQECDEGDSAMMFDIYTERQSSCGSWGKGSGSFDMPLMVNIASTRSSRRRRTSPALFDARGAGSGAWQRLREELGAAGAVSALLYEMPWSDKVA